MSTMSRPMRDDKQGIRCGNVPPPNEESLKRDASIVLKIKTLMREAFENLKVQVKAKEKLIMESKLRQMVTRKKMLGTYPDTTGFLVYVCGCKDRDECAQTEIPRTEHEENRDTRY